MVQPIAFNPELRAIRDRLAPLRWIESISQEITKSEYLRILTECMDRIATIHNHPKKKTPTQQYKLEYLADQMACHIHFLKINTHGWPVVTKSPLPVTTYSLSGYTYQYDHPKRW